MFKSSSLDSLHASLTTDNSILTSTKVQEPTSRIPVDINRRKSIIPTPNRPQVLIKSSTMVKEQASSLIDLKEYRNTSENETDDTLKFHSNNNDQYLELSNNQKLLEPHSSIIDSSENDNSHDRQHMPSNANDTHRHEHDAFPENVIRSNNFIETSQESNEGEKRSQSDDNKNYDNFDSFILQNFIPFSGEQKIIPWLDETERKLKEFHIGRTLRFEAISLLIEGETKRTYLKHRKEIRSFDDFYEFLLLNFDHSHTNMHNSKSDQPTASHLSNISTSVQNRSATKLTSTTMNVTEVTNLTRQIGRAHV